MVVKLLEGAEAAFRIEACNAFGSRFAANVHGAGRHGWYVASLRSAARDWDSGIRPLPKGEWPTLLHLVDRCGFWSLPEDGSHLAEPDVEVMDGEWLTVAGRDRERYHRIHRFIWREWGLEAILSFARRVSGQFVRHPVHGWWVSSDHPGLAASRLSTPATFAEPTDFNPSRANLPDG